MFFTGDFVYGALDQLSDEHKIARYQEFLAFDRDCRQRDILFFKVLFVSDRDSIGTTLGKRLAHKRIARDLHTWLDANSSPHKRAGMDEIENHIDPSDFVAFNRYDHNLAKFCQFARNTEDESQSSPWLVVSTAKRHPARLGLIKGFENQLAQFSRFNGQTKTKQTVPSDDSVVTLETQPSSISSKSKKSAQRGIVEAREHGVSIRAFALSIPLIYLAYSYVFNTWKVDINDIT